METTNEQYGRKLSPKELERAERINLGLAVSALTLKPGECRTAAEIAAFCGCARANIERIEGVALRKMRARLSKFIADENKYNPRRHET